MAEDLERAFRDAKASVWASAKHLSVAPQLIRAVSKFEKEYGVDRAQQIVEQLYDREQFIFSRVDDKLQLGTELDKEDHWLNELDEVMRYVGLEPKYMMIESRYNRSSLINSPKSPDGYAGELHGIRRRWETSLRKNPAFRPTEAQMYDFAREFDMRFPGQHIQAGWFGAASEPMKKLLHELSIIIKEGGELDADSTSIYTTFKRMRRADSQEEKELCDAVMSGLNQEGFQYVHRLLVQMRQWHQNNAYIKKLIDQLLDVAEHAHLELIKEDVMAWMKAISQGSRAPDERTPELKKQMIEIKELVHRAASSL